MPKGLTPDARARLRAAMARIRERYPRDLQDWGWQSKAAEALGVDQSTVNRAFKSGNAGSQDLVEKVATLLGEDPAEILFGMKGNGVPSLKDLPHFDECLREAKRRAELDRIEVPDWAWKSLAELRTRPPTKAVRPALLIELALAISEED